MYRLRKYVRLALCAMQEVLAYRMSYFINIIAQFVFYFAIFFVWQAVYASGAPVGGMTWRDMQGYLLVSLFTSAIVAGSSEFRVSRAIFTGNIAVELVRPVDYQRSNFAITIGNGIAEGVLVMGFGLVFALLIGLASLPSSALGWILFLAAMVLSFMLKFLVIYIFGLAAFWTTSGMGIAWLRRGLTDFFSGAIIPLSFFPDWLRGLADFLPFRGIVYVPASVFIGRMDARETLISFAVEAAWIVALWFLARLVWTFAMRKITIHGG